MSNIFSIIVLVLIEADGMDQTVLESDPFLCVEENEPEAWSISVEKKVLFY